MPGRGCGPQGNGVSMCGAWAGLCLVYLRAPSLEARPCPQLVPFRVTVGQPQPSGPPHDSPFPPTGSDSRIIRSAWTCPTYVRAATPC